MKKWGVICLSLMLMVSAVLSACSNGEGGNSGGNNKEEDTQLTLSEPGVLPITQEKTTIRITVPQDPTVISYEYGENELTTWLEDQTNVHIEWNLYPSTDSLEKLNLELSSGGDVGDLIMAFEVDNAMLATYGSQGVFRDLSDLIDKHGHYIKKMYDEVPGVQQATTAPDGKIYSLNTIGECYNCDRAMRFWINSSFLEVLNMDVPTTTEELYQYLKAVKEQDPNGNGEADEIPMVGSPHSWFAGVDDFIMNAFTYQDSDNLYVKDDQIVAAFTTPEWREGLRYLNKLYSEGLIDPSSFTNDENQMRQMVELNDGNTVGAVPGGGQHVFAANDSTKMNYEIVLPLEGPDGFKNAYYNRYGKIAGPEFILPANGKNADVVMKLIDVMYSPEFYMRARYGVEGKHWEKPEEGVLAANGGQALYRIIGKDLWQEPQQVHWHGQGAAWPTFGSDAREALPEGQFDLESVLYKAAKAYDEFAAEITVPRFFFDNDTSRRFNELKTEIKKSVDAATADFIVGNRSIEDDWESFQQELESIGIEEYMSIMQEEYDANWK
ncbi:extracellular solute-binding protein [Marinicrinis lubricantis]|uniref:Extracellular solute-binding protein n=1 Tax=Marinicrinis lubricantis TaxID=2086470 RepID=A0ABW1IJD2_9BACL